MGTEAFWVPVAAAVFGGAASAVIGSSMAPKSSAAPAMQQAPKEPESQVTKTPTAGAFSTANSNAAVKGGPMSTNLTGPQGIDPSLLNLGRNTLLGA